MACYGTAYTLPSKPKDNAEYRHSHSFKEIRIFLKQNKHDSSRSGDAYSASVAGAYYTMDKDYFALSSLGCRVVMSSASSSVTYTSVYTDFEPGRLVAPPSPDYIPGPKDPEIPPVPQDEDKREPMFIQPQDLDYVLEPIYLEYIPLEDEHVFPVEEKPLPPVDSPTTESPRYVAESDPEEDEDDETEDGLVDYPMDGGDDGDDDDGDSSGDDADDEDEDEEEEEH
ncbi:hypothetical protein Tco_0324932 [Tanacetum coccineum]